MHTLVVHTPLFRLIGVKVAMTKAARGSPPHHWVESPIACGGLFPVTDYNAGLYILEYTG
jgi:hypothetical protein